MKTNTITGLSAQARDIYIRALGEVCAKYELDENKVLSIVLSQSATKLYDFELNTSRLVCYAIELLTNYRDGERGVLQYLREWLPKRNANILREEETKKRRILNYAVSIDGPDGCYDDCFSAREAPPDVDLAEREDVQYALRLIGEFTETLDEGRLRTFGMACLTDITRVPLVPGWSPTQIAHAKEAFSKKIRVWLKENDLDRGDIGF